MELALLLVFLVLVELAVTAFLLGRIRDYKRSVKKLEKNVAHLAKSVADWDKDTDVPVQAEIDSKDFASLLENATEEDVQQAQAVLNALGFKPME